MATKKSSRAVSLTKQLAQAKQEISEHVLHIATLEKAKASAEQSQKYSNDRATEATKELNAIGTFLDAVPNPPAAKGADGYSAIAVMTRLMVYLATRPGSRNDF